MNKMLSAIGVLVLVAAGAGAEEAATPPPRPGTPIRLQIVLTRYQGEKKIASASYALSCNSNGDRAYLRTGIQVPLKFEGKDFPGNVVYKEVGNKMECGVKGLDDGRFKVDCSIDQSSLYAVDGGSKVPAPGGGEATLVPPMLRTFNSGANLIMSDGQTAQYALATDPANGEVYKIDLTLKVLK